LKESKDFELLLFYRDYISAVQGIEAGVDGIIVDWEYKGKHDRQLGFDTEVNIHTEQTLLEARKLDIRLICRVNGHPYFLKEEVQKALSMGADEILLPMVRGKQQVIEVLEIVGDESRLGILIETREGITNATTLFDMNLSRYYVGLNDLRVDMGYDSIFQPLTNGTIESIAGYGVHMGIAGLTHPDKGFPISCHLLLEEMCRLGMGFSFLRRSYYRDLESYSAHQIISSIRSSFTQDQERNAEAITRDQQELIVAISDIL